MILVFAILGYLVGSVNLSIILSRMKGKDIRTMGSGNAGSTNTLRTMGKGYAAVVFAFDVLKGVIPSLVLSLFGLHNAACAYGFFAVVGHCFPLYFGFKGGKGVATAIGVLLVIDTVPALVILAEFIIVLLLFRFVSLASVTAAINLPFLTLLFTDDVLLIIAMFLTAILVVYNHRGNIARIREGTEKPIFGGKK